MRMKKPTYQKRKERKNKFKCFICQEECLRGRLVKIESGMHEGSLAKVCFFDECAEKMKRWDV
jgi:hypothetical protein